LVGGTCAPALRLSYPCGEMPIEKPDVASNLLRVQERIERAAVRAGRNPADVSLVAVSKRKSAELIDVALAAGVLRIGENYVQEASNKIPHVRHRAEWHLIGHLQRNKARLASTLFEVIETVDSRELALALDRLGAERQIPLRVLLQVNIGDEASKHGIAPAELDAFIEALAPLTHVRIEGLMTIPPPADEKEGRAHFRALRRLRDHVAPRAPSNVALRELSMGMSDDFEIAIEEGATIVRVGRAIFGEREPR